MQVLFLSKFDKDLSKISQRNVFQDIENAILSVENAKSMRDIPALKKLKGHKIAYRIKIGNYRIGLYIEHNTVEFVRVVHRKDIYNLFP